MSTQARNTHRRQQKTILFLCPPSRLIPDFQHYLGTGYIIAYLKRRGYSAAQFVAEKPLDIRSCVKEVLSIKPRIVGFTVYDTNFCQCVAIAEALKTASPDCIILFGGPTASSQSEAILQAHPFVDICVRHEGEETVSEVLEVLESSGYLLKSAALEDVKGISHKVNGSIDHNPDRNALLHYSGTTDCLDRYPSPYLSGIITTARAGMVTARGCNQSCIYCNCAALSKRRITTHSVDRVIEELDCVSKLPASDAFAIYDDAFTLLPKRAATICDKIIENGIELPLGCVTRCDRVSEELLDKMKEAGFHYIGFSLESAVPRILRTIGKVHDPQTEQDPECEKERMFVEKFKHYVRYAKKIGIKHVYASIMTGLPGETPEEAEETVETIRSLSDCLDTYAHNIFTIFPGTPVFDAHEQYGIKLRRYSTAIHFKTIHAFDTNTISVAPKATQLMENEREHRETVRTLSLNLSKHETAPFLLNIVMQTEVITLEHVAWFREVLALRGRLIHLYPDRAAATKHYEANAEALLGGNSPVTEPMAYYYRRRPLGGSDLIPYRLNTYESSEEIDVCLPRVSEFFLDDDKFPQASQCVCVEIDSNDARQLHAFLIQLARSDSPARALYESRIQPYYAQLCRWGSSLPNCHKLETAFVDVKGNIRTCCNGAPIGKLGMSYEELNTTLLSLHSETESKRECTVCRKREGCSQCLFPEPWNESEYCQKQKNHDTLIAADLIRAFDTLKDIRPQK
ncbi:B12-binding domain-containing radical SAM protein [Acidobacteriota bacterium]